MLHPPFVSPWPSQEHRERERANKRAAVLHAAVRLFNEKGFHATSLDEVAEQLNVTKPTLYYYVRSKDEILAECVRAGLDMVRAGIAQAAASGGTALDRLRACMHAYASVVMMDFGRCVIRVGEDPLQHDSRRQLRQLKSQIDLEFRKLIEQGIAEGELAPCDPKLAAFTIAGGISWIGRWYRPDGELAPDAIAERCIALLLDGLVRRPAAAQAPCAAADAANAAAAGSPGAAGEPAARAGKPRRKRARKPAS